MRARPVALSVTLACLVSMACSAGGWAATVRGGSLWAGERAFLAMQLGAPASSCQLVASGPRRARQLLSTVRLRQRQVKWIWVVPPRARTARWRVEAMCGANRLFTSYVVHGNRRYRPHHHAALELALARHVRVVQFGGAFPRLLPAHRPLAAPPAAVIASAPQPPAVQAQAQAWWAQNASWILSQFHTGASAGQCTDYVAAQRPDVIQRVDTWAYGRYLMADGGALGVDWTAKNWLLDAYNAGMPIGRLPTLGAVMVFQPGAYGAYSSGHVAIVTAIHSDGSFTISEMHAPVVGQLTTRTFDAPTALGMVADPGVGFIYR